MVTPRAVGAWSAGGLPAGRSNTTQNTSVAVCNRCWTPSQGTVKAAVFVWKGTPRSPFSHPRHQIAQATG
jgi:hypothetical protein